MKATDFELRHQTPVHLTLVTAAFLTYLVDPDDMVWKLVRGEPHARLLERLLFAVATVLIGTGSWLRTRALVEGGSELSGQPTRREGFSRVLTYPQHLGNLLFSIGLASLAPLWGFVLLAAGETVVVIRLIGREEAIREQEAGKWGLFVTMIVFTLLLRDRVAEVLAVLSFVTWAVLNIGWPRRSVGR